MSIDLTSIQGILVCLAFFFAGVVDSISGGGGLITIPAMLAVGIPPHSIIGTNQFACWAGTGVATVEYARSGNIHRRSSLITIPFAILGAYLGARWNLQISERYLQIFMILSIPVIAVLLLMKRDLGETDRIKGMDPWKVAAGAAAIGLVLGAYQGFYGAGSGTLFVLAYTAILRLNLVRATGNSRFVLAVALTASVLTYAFSGTVLWKLAVAAMIFHAAGSYLGARIAIRKGSRIIRPILILMVAALFVKLIADLLA